jgi:hypothetical protein
MSIEAAAKNLYDLHRRQDWPAFYNLKGNGRDYWRALATTAEWPKLEEAEVWNPRFDRRPPKEWLQRGAS